MSRAARASGRPSRVWEDVETRVTDADASLTPEAASDRATRWLRSLIISGELGPGDWFPPERILAEKLGISRLTLRTALKTLEGTGYIVTERGVAGGSRVNDASALLQCWTQWMLFQSEDLEDILEMRRTIETRIAVLAARMRTTDELRAMEAAVAREWASRADLSALFHTDMQIHRAIADGAHSRRLERAMVATREELFLPVDQALMDGRELEMNDSHRAIVEAVADRDEERAARNAEHHVLLVEALLQRAVQASIAALSSVPPLTGGGELCRPSVRRKSFPSR